MNRQEKKDCGETVQSQLCPDGPQLALEEGSTPHQEAPNGRGACQQGRPSGNPGGQQPVPGATASLVLGILAIILPFAGLVTGAIAIVMGRRARKAAPLGTPEGGMATAGYIMGIVGVCLWALVLTCILIGLAWLVPIASSVPSIVEPDESFWFTTGLAHGLREAGVLFA